MVRPLVNVEAFKRVLPNYVAGKPIVPPPMVATTKVARRREAPLVKVVTSSPKCVVVKKAAAADTRMSWSSEELQRKVANMVSQMNHTTTLPPTTSGEVRLIEF